MLKRMQTFVIKSISLGAKDLNHRNHLRKFSTICSRPPPSNLPSPARPPHLPWLARVALQARSSAPRATPHALSTSGQGLQLPGRAPGSGAGSGGVGPCSVQSAAEPAVALVTQLRFSPPHCGWLRALSAKGAPRREGKKEDSRAGRVSEGGGSREGGDWACATDPAKEGRRGPVRARTSGPPAAAGGGGGSSSVGGPRVGRLVAGAAWATAAASSGCRISRPSGGDELDSVGRCTCRLPITPRLPAWPRPPSAPPPRGAVLPLRASGGGLLRTASSPGDRAGTAPGPHPSPVRRPQCLHGGEGAAWETRWAAPLGGPSAAAAAPSPAPRSLARRRRPGGAAHPPPAPEPHPRCRPPAPEEKAAGAPQGRWRRREVTTPWSTCRCSRSWASGPTGRCWGTSRVIDAPGWGLGCGATPAFFLPPEQRKCSLPPHPVCASLGRPRSQVLARKVLLGSTPRGTQGSRRTAAARAPRTHSGAFQPRGCAGKIHDPRLPPCRGGPSALPSVVLAE